MKNEAWLTNVNLPLPPTTSVGFPFYCRKRHIRHVRYVREHMTVTHPNGMIYDFPASPTHAPSCARRNYTEWTVPPAISSVFSSGRWVG